MKTIYSQALVATMALMFGFSASASPVLSCTVIRTINEKNDDRASSIYVMRSPEAQFSYDPSTEGPSKAIYFKLNGALGALSLDPVSSDEGSILHIGLSYNAKSTSQNWDNSGFNAAIYSQRVPGRPTVWASVGVVANSSLPETYSTALYQAIVPFHVDTTETISGMFILDCKQK